jgi:hypothetical protein
MSKKIMYGVIVSLLLLAVTGCFAARPMAAEAPMEEPQGVAVREVVVEKEAEVEWDAGDAMPGSGANYDDEGTVTSAPVDAVERLIIRNAWLDLVVPDTEDALDEIKDVTDEMEGFVVQSNVYQYGDSKRASIQIRIPAEKLDEALEHFRGMASEVRSENVSGQDVTDEYVDLQSRLRSKEATEAKLLEFLDEAEDTEAALAVYTELERIQTDIEVIKGRMQYLEESAAMSAVSIELTPDVLTQPIEVRRWNPTGTFKGAVEALIRVLQFLLDALIVIVVTVLPILIVVFGPLVVLILIIRAIVRRRRARKAE